MAMLARVLEEWLLSTGRMNGSLLQKSVGLATRINISLACSLKQEYRVASQLCWTPVGDEYGDWFDLLFLKVPLKN